MLYQLGETDHRACLVISMTLFIHDIVTILFIAILPCLGKTQTLTYCNHICLRKVYQKA